MEEIFCPSCQKTKPASEFYKNVKRKNGHQQYCKECMNAMNKRSAQKRIKAKRLSKQESLPFEEIKIPVVNEMSKQELTHFIEINEKQQDFIDKSISEIPTPIIRRTGNKLCSHIYFTTDGEVKLYCGITKAIELGLANKGEGLNAWKVQMRVQGKDPDAYAKYRADFGTIMHFLYGKMASGESLPLSVAGLREYIKDNASGLIVNDENYTKILSQDMNEMVMDVACFAKFCHDYNVKPLFSEKMLKSDKYGIASAIDLFCEMDKEETGYFGEVYKTNTADHKAGDPKLSKGIKRIHAIIDFKSNRSGSFQPEHKIQLAAYKMMMEENYRDIPIDAVYNFSPKEWSKSSQYTLKDQTDNSERFLKKVDLVLRQGVMNFEDLDFKDTILVGTASINSNTTDWLKTIDLKEELNRAFCKTIVIAEPLQSSILN